MSVDTSSFDRPDSPPIPTWRVIIAALSESTAELSHQVVNDEDLADFAHIVRDLEKRLAEIRQEREAEAAELIPKGGRLEGATQSGGLVSTPKNSYSFSTALILRDTMNGLGPGATVPQALGFLEQRGALQMKWLVSKVRPALNALGVAAIAAEGEIEPDSAEAHIGKSTTWKVERDNG